MTVQARFRADLFSIQMQQRRKELKMSRVSLAHLAGVNPSTIFRIERWETVPNITTYVSICNILGLPPTRFWTVTTD